MTTYGCDNCGNEFTLVPDGFTPECPRCHGGCLNVFFIKDTTTEKGDNQ